jgi:hypothetical protein
MSEKVINGRCGKCKMVMSLCECKSKRLPERIDKEFADYIKLSDLKPYRFTEKELKVFIKDYIKLSDVLAVVDELLTSLENEKEWDECWIGKITTLKFIKAKIKSLNKQSRRRG